MQICQWEAPGLKIQGPEGAVFPFKCITLLPPSSCAPPPLARLAILSSTSRALLCQALPNTVLLPIHIPVPTASPDACEAKMMCYRSLQSLQPGVRETCYLIVGEIVAEREWKA